MDDFHKILGADLETVKQVTFQSYFSYSVLALI